MGEPLPSEELGGREGITALRGRRWPLLPPSKPSFTKTMALCKRKESKATGAKHRRCPWGDGGLCVPGTRSQARGRISRERKITGEHWCGSQRGCFSGPDLVTFLLTKLNLLAWSQRSRLASERADKPRAQGCASLPPSSWPTPTAVSRCSPPCGAPRRCPRVLGPRPAVRGPELPCGAAGKLFQAVQCLPPLCPSVAFCDPCVCPTRQQAQPAPN